ncbi:MAG: hypothetical protein LQ352_002329 [Teloschistes flavicans]|nr:MAG: hypothetical protein LQ352_002329 [Teloschistes flavicans]
MFDVFLSGNPTRLAQVIRSGEYLDFTEEQDKRFVREPNLIEQDLTQYYKNALISTILKGQMCYIECSSKRSSQSDITRFEPEEGKFCAAKCWQNWASEKTLKVYGLDEIAKPDNDWGIQVRAFLEASYDHYKTNGFQNGQMLPSAEDLFDDEVETTSGSYLPVCDSHITHKESKVSGIPCMCGNEYGSDTAKFWEEANFASWKAVQINGDLETKKGPPYLCKNDMAYERTPPVAYFLNMCNMDWRWPTKKDDAHLDDNLYLHKGADPLCGLFKEEVDKFKQDQAAGALEPGVMPNLDCYMCYQSTAGGRVQHGDMCQKDNILNLFRHKGDPRSHKFQDYNFKRACELMEEESEMCGVGSS